MFKKTSLLGLIVALIIGLTGLPAESKFRDVVNFEDNSFVSMDNTELLHRYRKISGYDEDFYDHTRLTYQFAYGILPNFEVGITLPVVFSDGNDTVGGEEGIGDVEVYQKFKFSEKGERMPETSGGYALILPTADDEGPPYMGTKKLDARFFVTVGHEFSERTDWLVNFSMRFSGDGDVENKYRYNAALVYQMLDNAKLAFEFNGQTGGIRDETEHYLSPGILFQPRDNLSLNLTVPIGLGSEAADHRAAVQLAVDF